MPISQELMIRFDSLPIPKMVRTKEGYLRGTAVVSRAGVFQYMNMDGTIRGELRHPEEVFKQSSLETLKMIPITNDHPPEFVDASNVHKYQVGQTGETYDIDNDQIIVSMTITHQDAIDAIESGKVELSMGYLVDLKSENGQFKGEHYDARQLEPRYNHLAIVERGRAGSVARLRFDNASELVQAQTRDIKQLINLNKDDMNKDNTSRIDALNSENEQLSAKLTHLQLRLDLAEEATVLAKKELEEERALKIDTIIASKVMDRVELITKATPFIGDQVEDISHKTDREIMEVVINSLRADTTNFKERSDDYVRGVFETAINTPSTEHMDKNRTVFNVTNRMNNDKAIRSDAHNAIAENIKKTFFNLNEVN